MELFVRLLHEVLAFHYWDNKYDHLLCFTYFIYALNEFVMYKNSETLNDIFTVAHTKFMLPFIQLRNISSPQQSNHNLWPMQLPHQ